MKSLPFSGLARRRRLCLLLGAILVAAGITFGKDPVGHSALWAQSNEPALETDGAAPPASPLEGTEPPQQRTLLDTIRDGGLIGLVIILLSMAAVGLIVEHAMAIRKSVLMPDEVVEELEQLVHQGQIDRALEASRDPDNDSLFAHVVQAGLERFRSSEFGFAEYKAAVEEAGEDHTGRLYRKTEILGVIGAVAPMLGLTGTVLGMIKAFNTIALSGGMAKPEELAGGISQALVTTLMGLLVAIPTMVAFSYFRNKIDSIVSETGKRVEQVLMPLGQRRV